MNLKGIMQTLGAQPGQVVSNPFARAFAPQPTPVNEEEKIEEQDHEVSMAQNQLDSIIKNATELKGKIGNEEKNIAGWIQDHITNAENYIEQANGGFHELEESLNEEFKHIISVETPTQVVSKPIAAQILALAKKGVRSKDIGLKMGFVGNQKAATDAFQKVKNKIYFSLNKTESVNEGKKAFKVNPGIGRAKYSISSHDGKKKHNDGSDFWDIEIFKNKVDLEKAIKKYTSNGFVKESVNEARLTDIVNSIVETPVIGKMVSRTPSTTQVTEAKKYDIGAGYMGNGLTIWNRAEQEHGDYRIIAHIDPYGKISIRDKQIPSNVMKMIEDWAVALKKGDK